MIAQPNALQLVQCYMYEWQSATVWPQRRIVDLLGWTPHMTNGMSTQAMTLDDMTLNDMTRCDSR
jgi:hypothetical protein